MSPPPAARSLLLSLRIERDSQGESQLEEGRRMAETGGIKASECHLNIIISQLRKFVK